MGTGQMMITMGALVILAIVVLRINNSFLSTNEAILNGKFGVLAVSLATSIIEEAQGKAFDLATAENSVDDLNSLTPAGSLGPAWGEQYENYNDFDDYNGLSRIDSSMISAVFKVDCVVEYVKSDNPDAHSNSRTWHKKLTVFVSSKSMEDTVKMSSIFSYFYFR